MKNIWKIMIAVVLTAIIVVAVLIGVGKIKLEGYKKCICSSNN